MRRRLDNRFTAVQTLAVAAGTPALYPNGMVASVRRSTGRPEACSGDM